MPPVTGPVKSRHTSLKLSRPAAGFQPHSLMQRCLVPLFRTRSGATSNNMQDQEVILENCVRVKVCVCVCLALFVHTSERGSVTCSRKRGLSAETMNFRLVCLMNEPLEGMGTQTVL